ncbi:hypothetical protein E0L36_25225 [Streptomyces sp. AJS327]|nr:hypothetical protein [Streptomyces sp. AJS327]
MPQQITALTRTDHPHPRPVPASVIHPPLTPTPHTAMRPEEIPPGVTAVTLPDGRRVLAYTQPAPAPAPPPPVPQSIPAWAKTTALLAPAIGSGIAVGAWGLAAAAPGVLAMASALWATVAAIAVGGVALALITRARRPTHITQHINARGFMSRANGTINR